LPLSAPEESSCERPNDGWILSDEAELRSMPIGQRVDRSPLPRERNDSNESFCSPHREDLERSRPESTPPRGDPPWTQERTRARALGKVLPLRLEKLDARFDRAFEGS
jgi:hypothetical protein